MVPWTWGQNMGEVSTLAQPPADPEQTTQVTIMLILRQAVPRAFCRLRLTITQPHYYLHFKDLKAEVQKQGGSVS